jgi:HEAT repeat protein
VKTLLKTAQDSDRKVRLESFKALKTISGEKDLPALVDALIGVQHEADRREAEKTVAAVAHTIDEKNRRAEVRRIAGSVLPSVKDVKIRCSLLRVLGKIGDDSAVPTLRTALKDTDAQVKDAAIRALSEWPTAVPLPDLLKIAQTSDNKIHHVLALRGFVRLIGLGSGRSAKETIGMYKQAMSQASSAGEKKLVLSGLANMKTFAALQMAAGYLEDEALQQEAKAAVATIAAKEAKEAIESADPVMGDWQGSWKLDDGNDSGQLVTHVIALGQGKYRAKFLKKFDQRVEPIAVLEGQHRDGVVRFAGSGESDGITLQIKAAIEGNKFTGSFQGQDQDVAGSFTMEKVVRFWRTLGAKPPKGAVVLFSGENFKEWKHTGKKPDEDSVQWKLVDDAMEVKPGSGSIITIKEFTDVNLHLEFRTPFMPEARGQGRSNSGVYLQGRYEVQVLDSYGLEGRENECGGIYGVAQPLVNMCAPPTQWQTYDITYRVPRFDSTGKKINDARMTVIHNGVKIHNNVKVSKATTAAPGGDVGGIYLQDHGNTVQYRNIWLVELPEKPVSD